MLLQGKLRLAGQYRSRRVWGPRRDKLSAGRDSKGWVGGSVLDARKRLIDGECARQMFGSLFLQVVATHAVKGKRHKR